MNSHDLDSEGPGDQYTTQGGRKADATKRSDWHTP